MTRAAKSARSLETDSDHVRDFAGIAHAYAVAAAADVAQRQHCKWVRLAAQRHLDDLERAQSPDWGFHFDPWHANDVCDFIEKLPHVKGNWCKCPNARDGDHLPRCGLIDLEPAQIFTLAMVFGWRRNDNGFRRFTMGYEEEARKNAKSTKMAGVALYCLTCEGENGPEVLAVATTFDQAKKVFEPARLMVKKTPDLAEWFDLVAWAKSITCEANGGTVQPLHSKSESQDGHNPHLVVLDEFHAHRDRGLFDVMRSAFGARKNPLMWAITTAGPNTNGPCYEERAYAIQILEGTAKADHYFAIIYTLDRAEDYDDDRTEGDDPFDEALWIKSNPLLGSAVSLDELRQYGSEAKQNPAAEGAFKNKRLNIWTGALSAWLNVAQWQRCGDPSLSLDDFKGLDCYVGADLSAVDDLSAITLAAMDAAGRLLVKTWVFVPEARLKREDSKLKHVTKLYQGWAKEGALTVTEGDLIDQDAIEALIRELKAALAIRGATFDQWTAGYGMASRLNEDFNDGDDAFASILPKNAKNTTNPATQIEARVRAGPKRLRHDANPVMTWMVGNAVVDRRTDGSLLPKKEHKNSPNKIDGVDSLMNASAPMFLTTPTEAPPEYQLIIL